MYTRLKQTSRRLAAIECAGGSRRTKSAGRPRPIHQQKLQKPVSAVSATLLPANRHTPGDVVMRLPRLPLVLFLCAAAVPALAGPLDDGLAAYRKGDWTAALAL